MVLDLKNKFDYLAEKGVFMRTCIVASLFFLTACTFSINQIHTEGSAADVVDEEQDANPVISPTISVPVKPL